MKELFPLRGIVTVLNTPFNEDDTINLSALRKNVKEALNHLGKNDKYSWAGLLMDYYDKTYDYSNAQRNGELVHQYPLTWKEAEKALELLINNFKPQYLTI